MLVHRQHFYYNMILYIYIYIKLSKLLPHLLQTQKIYHSCYRMVSFVVPFFDYFIIIVVAIIKPLLLSLLINCFGYAPKTMYTTKKIFFYSHRWHIFFNWDKKVACILATYVIWILGVHECAFFFIHCFFLTVTHIIYTSHSLTPRSPSRNSLSLTPSPNTYMHSFEHSYYIFAPLLSF